MSTTDEHTFSEIQEVANEIHDRDVADARYLQHVLDQRIIRRHIRRARQADSPTAGMVPALISVLRAVRSGSED